MPINSNNKLNSSNNSHQVHSRYMVINTVNVIVDSECLIIMFKDNDLVPGPNQTQHVTFNNLQHQRKCSNIMYCYSHILL